LQKLFPRHRLNLRRVTLASVSQLSSLFSSTSKPKNKGIRVFLFEGYAVFRDANPRKGTEYWWLTQKTNASDASSLKRHGLTLQRLKKAMKTSRQRWLWIGEGMFWDARQSFVRPLSTLHLSEGWKTPLQTKLWKLGCAQNAFNSCRKQAELQLRTTKKNPNAAISTIASLLKRGCRGGDGLSCLKLGILLRQGIRLKRDLKRARALLQQACEHRQGHGCLLLGVERQYRQGKHALAPPLYKRGCEYKAALSCAMYANTLVRKGKTPQRCKQAKRWLKRACQLGMKRACRMKLCP
jgi:hypothetical protein